MSETTEIAKVRLPQNMLADDVLTLHEQIAHRIAAVVHLASATKRKHATDASAVALPAGLSPIERLPDQIGGPWGRFTSAIDALSSVHTARAKAASDDAATKTATAQDDANRECDACWTALDPWLEGWTLSQDDGELPTPADAAWLYGALFPKPEGRKFINHRPRLQWKAMKPRMEVLASERGQSVIKGFGGERLYKQLAASHTRFGKAFGFLALVADADDPETDARPELNAAKEALREFVRKVESYAEPTISGSEALSAFLLKPFLDLVDELATSAARKKPVATGTNNGAPVTDTSTATSGSATKPRGSGNS